MKLSNSGDVTSVLRIVEQQPALLVQEDTEVDLEESPEDQIPAWESGIMSDVQNEWDRRYQELCNYNRIHKDAHVGFREGDSIELTRWCNKQRKEAKEDSLSAAKCSKLTELGFEYEQDEAEWMRWYAELQKYQTDAEFVSPAALSNCKNFFLMNWCSVQRVANRTGVLSRKHRLLLDEISFDWTAPDALS